MRTRIVLIYFFILTPLLGAQAWADGGNDIRKHVQCVVPVGVGGAPAMFYAEQIPVLIRNEKTKEDSWVYAYACVRDRKNLQDLGWSNLSVERPVTSDFDSGHWTYQFDHDEKARGRFLYDVFGADNFTFTTYIPLPDFRSEEDRSANGHLVETVEVPYRVRLGIAEPMDTQLADAGMIVDRCNSDPHRVLLLYSMDPNVRNAWTCADPQLKPRKFISAWLNAPFLLCDASRSQNRPLDDEHEEMVRTFMLRDPQFEWGLAQGQADCSNVKNAGPPGSRKWGGGIAVYYLFPNIELGPLSVTYDGDYAVVTGTVINDSAATGDVSVLYKWTSDSHWQDDGTTARIEPYQGVPRQGVTRAPASFTLRIKRPDTPGVLSVFLWPRDNTPLAALHRDLSTGWAAFTAKYPEMLAHNEPWDEHYDARWAARWGDVWETELTPATHERQTRDNLRTILVQPGCDLSVQLTTPASASQQGFDFQVHVTKTQCALTQVPLEILVNGNRLPDQLTFAGTTAYGEYHSGSLAGLDSALIEVRVDHGHIIRESDETNNIQQRLVPVERETITCPSGVSPDECFRSQLNN